MVALRARQACHAWHREGPLRSCRAGEHAVHVRDCPCRNEQVQLGLEQQGVPGPPLPLKSGRACRCPTGLHGHDHVSTLGPHTAANGEACAVWGMLDDGHSWGPVHAA